ncbi:pimeloyl-ACP methyl ester carboxylesterase [Paenibacillus phyllosphaerae]|uniref:Pimeloyl-ACP methyl ester carboxylesterase n=1 Tax=Paenibacillus phyllosphaerae TaxID=274593 RepID=A0A7W5AXW7_9BACL|nr:alpha/beta hydrolase [Paenibacillus phyllosphaerae]MBB3110166.1 pimeloyl-ACP methyl ester carboxylesterase [Paenibacillus phyllosphaerae]
MRIDKQMMQTSQGNLQYHCSGSGSPAIVLINGGSGPIEGWMRVLPELTQLSTVMGYNRLGVGASDKPSLPQDGMAIVNMLHEMLGRLDLKPPYLLVGHSLGGLYANLYARLFPDEIAGVVFLEASTPKDITLDRHQGSFVKLLNKLLTATDTFFPHKQYDEVRFVKQTIAQIEASGRFPNVPVFVLTGGKENKMIPPEVRQERLSHQLELLALSTDSTHIAAEQSGHFPQLTEPKLVIDTIRACLERVRSV